VAEPKQVEAYPEGDVELFHPEINASMKVPQESVEVWRAAGWVDAKRSKSEGKER